MGVDHAEGGRLVPQIVQNATEDDVLEHIGEIAGVKFVIVIHGLTGFVHPPRMAGIAILSTRQARREISAQSWKEISLPRHTRTSVNRLPSQDTAIAARDRPGLAFTKAAATSSGVTVIGSFSAR